MQNLEILILAMNYPRNNDNYLRNDNSDPCHELSKEYHRIKINKCHFSLYIIYTYTHTQTRAHAHKNRHTYISKEQINGRSRKHVAYPHSPFNGKAA